MKNSFLFFNIISFDFYTLRPTLFQFFYPLRKVGVLFWSMVNHRAHIFFISNFSCRILCTAPNEIPMISAISSIGFFKSFLARSLQPDVLGTLHLSLTSGYV